MYFEIPSTLSWPPSNFILMCNETWADRLSWKNLFMNWAKFKQAAFSGYLVDGACKFRRHAAVHDLHGEFHSQFTGLLLQRCQFPRNSAFVCTTVCENHRRNVERSPILVHVEYKQSSSFQLDRFHRSCHLLAGVSLRSFDGEILVFGASHA